MVGERWAARRLPSAESVQLLSRLAALLGAGVTLPAAFASLSESSAGSKAVHSAIDRARRDVAVGVPLSTAVTSSPLVFGDAASAFFAEGERCGRLAESAHWLAEFVAAEREWGRLWQRFVRSLVYPFVVFSIVPACLCVGTLAWPGPAVTRVVRFLVVIVHVYAVPALIATAGWLGLGIRVVREWWDHRLLALGAPGRLCYQLLVHRVVATFDAANRAGMSVRSGLELAADGVGNAWLGSGLRVMADSIAQGCSPAEALRHSSLLPPAMGLALAHACETDTLDHVLATLARQLRQDAAEAVRRFSLLAAGTTVVGICLSVAVVGVIIAIAAMR